MKLPSPILAVSIAFGAFLPSQASGQILRLAELNTEQIRKLDRAKTAVLMPGGVLEQHGPYLPSFTDGYMNEWWTERLAEAIIARPGWTALVFPLLPLGDGGANEIGDKYVFPGTYGVRVATLRAVYMDLATELGEQGFRWIFLIHNHGSPMHNQALDQAGDYFRDTYGGQMVNICGLEPADALPPPKLSAEAAKANGIDLHAGLSETSRMIFLKPDLVSARVAQAPDHGGFDFPKLGQIARDPAWPGYFGAPRYATAAHGEAVMRQRSSNYNRSALAILDGKDPRDIPRFAPGAIAATRDGVAQSLAYDETVRKRQADWLKKNGLE